MRQLDWQEKIRLILCRAIPALILIDRILGILYSHDTRSTDRARQLLHESPPALQQFFLGSLEQPLVVANQFYAALRLG